MSGMNSDALLGRTLAGRYELLAVLGRGGMATVYQARQPALDRFVAVKVIAPSFASEPNFVERFRREARTVARLHHPHILTIYDFGDDAGLLYLVTELIEGGTLRDYLRGPLPIPSALTILEQVGAALDYAHQQGIIHRDVKPGNIFLRGGDRQQAVLADFGIAKVVADTTGPALTQSGVGMGTPEYIAPEQALGQPVDGRADLYALGVILYEMLAGRPPFRLEGESDTPIALALRQIRETPPPPRAFNPALSPALEAVVLRALAKRPDDRYPTGAALVEAARAATATHSGAPTVPVAAPLPGPATLPASGPPPALVPPPVPPRRSSWVLPLTMFLLVLVVGLAAMVVVLGRPLLAGQATATTVAAVTPPRSSPTPPAPSPTPPPATATLVAAVPTATPLPPTATVMATATPVPTATGALSPTAVPTAPPATATAVASGPPTPNPRVENAARTAFAALPGTATGIFLNLGSGSEVVLRDADKVMPTGSVIKLFIAGEAYHQVASGRLTLNDPFTVKQSDVVGGTGILQNQVGKTYTLDELVEITLVYSDNTGANMLIDRLGGFTPVNNFIVSLGLTNTKLNRRLADTAAQARGIENVSTAREVSIFLLKLELGQIVDQATSRRILTILQRRAQVDQNWLLVKLPTGVDAAHITGTLPGLRVDAGIIRPTPSAAPYILVIFDQTSDETGAERAIANASSDIYQAIVGR